MVRSLLRVVDGHQLATRRVIDDPHFLRARRTDHRAAAESVDGLVERRPCRARISRILEFPDFFSDSKDIRFF